MRVPYLERKQDLRNVPSLELRFPTESEKEISIILSACEIISAMSRRTVVIGVDTLCYYLVGYHEKKLENQIIVG